MPQLPLKCANRYTWRARWEKFVGKYLRSRLDPTLLLRQVTNVVHAAANRRLRE